MNTQVTHTSEIWMNHQTYKKPDVLRVYGSKYPHFGFACTACGSLEVFISLGDGITEGKCIDYNTIGRRRLDDIRKSGYTDGVLA